MAVLAVRRYGDPILRQKAQRVTEVTPQIKKTIEEMVETMFHQVGIGLAAPQVGIPLRLVVIDDGKRGTRALVNPTITERRGTAVGEEGCLSLPGVFAEVERSEWVNVEALDGDGKPISFEGRGLIARVVQHELDHLDGVLFIDHLPAMVRDRIKRRIQKEGLPDKAPHHAFAL
jgi:peptide deformylase